MLSTPFYKLVFGSLALLMTFYTNEYKELDKVKFFHENEDNFLLPQIEEFDFIVVGAGSAGSIVANRLSEKFSVLLLESGGDPIPQVYVPANFKIMSEFSPILHEWKSIKQLHSALDSDGIATLAQGKFLGGSSTVNGMGYNRGNPSDYDLWAELSGDESWSYKNVLKYFQMTEDFYDEENKDGHLGVGGPLTIRKSGGEVKPINSAFLRAGKELGYDSFVNSNAPQSKGFGPFSQNVRDGRRVSAYDAYLKPVLDRITISRYSDVSHIDIDKSGKAVGVFYTRHGVQMYAKARKEIIISAGSMNSPMVLLRSGIGPESQLKEAGIEIKAVLPVGQNFQDHPWTGVFAKFDDPSKIPLRNFSQADVDDFLKNGTGPLTLIWGISTAQALIVSSAAKSEGNPDWPDIQITAQFNSTVYTPGGDDSVMLMCILGRVSSRGSVSLDTKNPANTLWDPRWLENERDFKVLIEAAKIATQIINSQAFKDIGLTLDRTPVKGCENKNYGDDDYWECHVRQYTRTLWHPIGTCRMGKHDDPTAVVDTKLKVKGINGLRVIDNSIQPKITNVNTNAPALMIGQKGADMILQEHGQSVNNSPTV